MTKRYTGGVVSSSLPTVNAAGASGVFNLSQQADAQTNNKWPPFKVEKSLRFRAAASAYLSRTIASNGNATTWTYSTWMKRGTLGAAQDGFIEARVDGNNNAEIAFTSSDTLYIGAFNGGSTVYSLITTQVFRDPSAWYHIVVAVDTTQATSSNRVKLYINGVRVTAFSTETYPSQNATTYMSQTSATHNIGRWPSPTQYFDGFLAETIFVDGQQLTSSSFGGTDKDGNWSPIAYTGTYGLNGFYLNFKDATSTSTIGYDYSGNGNNWSSSGISVTAGATNDSLYDVPSDQAGTNSRSNYCTLNPLHYALGGANYYAISSANQRITGTSASNSGGTIGTMASATGKFYYEFNMTGVDASGYSIVGACDVDQYSTLTSYNYIGYGSKSYGYNSSGVKSNNNGTSSYGASYTTGDVIGVAIDCDNGAIYFSKNGTWQNSGDPTSGATRTGAAYTWTAGSQKMIPQIDVYRTGSIVDSNFGQRAFSYAIPVGFKTLNTYDLPEPTIKQPNKHFNIATWTGTGTSSGRSITGVGFQPDLVWGKPRSLAYSHTLSDSVRGANKRLSSGLTTAEQTNFTYGYTSSFDSDGFTTSAGSTDNENWNTTGESFVAWNWKAAGSNTTNTSGSITSTVSVNASAGFSIVTYNTGSAGNQTVGHGLGQAPAMIIIKSRVSSSAHWDVWHKSFSNPAQGYMYLNLTNAVANDSRNWANTAPTSTVFSFESGYEFGANSNYVAYCFAEVSGYSAFGSYTGNGSTDGPFVHLGFRPRYLMVKCSSSSQGGAADWIILDTSRDTYNLSTKLLYADLSNAEETYNITDLLSNGFKQRNTYPSLNSNGATYIYAAFAEMPFKYARAR